MTQLGPIIDDKPFHNLKAREDDLIAKIDERGGWPPKAKCLVLNHGTTRDCYFSEADDVRDGWNTSIMTADDYHWAKVSQARKDQFAKEKIRAHLRRMMP